MYFFLQIAVNGLAAGAIYGLIAVGYSLTFMSTRTLNFGLGMWVTLGGMLTYSLYVQYSINPLITFTIVAITVFIIGLAAERVSVHPFLRARSELWVMSTLAVGFLLVDIAEITWGRTPHGVPPYLGDTPVHFREISIRPQQLLIIVAACIIFFALDYFYRRTLIGKAFRALAHSRDVSSLMGINVGLYEVLSYAAAATFAGIAGFLIVPLTGAEPHLGTGLGIKAFAIAIIAGLNAPRGILIFGLFYGVFEGLVSGYLFTGIRDIVGFSLMIVALYLRPHGLFGSKEEGQA